MPRKTPGRAPGEAQQPLRFNEAAARCHGKRRLRKGVGRHGPVASMRPRPDATENLDDGGQWSVSRPASMRPRPDATENSAAGSSGGCRLLVLQ